MGAFLLQCQRLILWGSGLWGKGFGILGFRFPGFDFQVLRNPWIDPIPTRLCFFTVSDEEPLLKPCMIERQGVVGTNSSWLSRCDLGSGYLKGIVLLVGVEDAEHRHITH